MGALKAIRITKENKQNLESQYNMPEDFLEYSSGLYLLAEFGDTQYKALLTKGAINLNYDFGKPLQNGFVEVTRKAA